MTNSEHESTAAWRELLDTLSGLDRSFLAGERAVADDRQIADGYRMLATTLGVAFDTYLFGEPSRPMFVEVNTPFRRDRRWGGDACPGLSHGFCRCCCLSSCFIPAMPRRNKAIVRRA